MSEYIEIVLHEEKPKTSVYVVYSKRLQIPLARIAWYGAWRQYVLCPEPDTFWNTGCLEYINNFIKKLMEERKK